ncbi:MAG: phenylalanine--tRNA ligase subunit beta [Gemmatimonadetes bacterium]|nr:phenylalanine--tRNA ligase subunit beta [Gemmatimonadota bacterium]
MNLSYRWLQALAPDLTDPPAALADRLAGYGAPVDELLPLGEPLRDIVIARVQTVRKHPAADRLSLCDVEVGSGPLLQVVCGAPNVREGAYYPFAPVGAVLPSGIELKKTRIRGQESQGMLCSERELGLGRDHQGIMELHGRFNPGEPLVPALGLDDVRLVVDVTANRPDLLCHYGVARELAARGEAGLTLPEVPGTAAAGDGAGPRGAAYVPDLVRAVDSVALGGVTVRLEDPAGCPRYLGAVVRGVTIAPAPEWLASRLRAVGLRPINNVVDATNYVLYELGQPLHAFDLARLAGPEVVIRRAAAGETLITLDAERHVLSEDMLVIADADRPVAVAGVMGGLDSEVTAQTRDLFLECALFDPRTVRIARRALGLPTEASYRFERGVDPEGLERALRRAVALISAVAGGATDPAAADLYPQPRTAPLLTLRPSRVSHVLGSPFDADSVASYLEPLGFAVVERTGHELRVRVPGHRWYDVWREVDLIEEVARRHGYERFPDRLEPARPSAVPEDPLFALEDRLRSHFVARGFLEARSAALAPAEDGDVALLNPLSSSESRLRRALLPALLRHLEYNFSRGARHVRLFEIGTVFAPGPVDEPPRESTRVAAVFTGSRLPPHWSEPVPELDVWDLKALLAEMADLLQLGAAAVRPEPGIPGAAAGRTGLRGADPLLEPGVFTPGLTFGVWGEAAALLGRGGPVERTLLHAPAWAGRVWGLEFLLPYPPLPPRTPAFRPIPAFPATERDLALVMPDQLTAAAVEATIREAASSLLEHLAPFDVYRGAPLPVGTRSIAYRLRFRAADRTLTDAEADQVVGRVLQRLKERLGVEPRT